MTGHAVNLSDMPTVLDGNGTVLDIAPRRRLHSMSQRLAISHRDGGCSWEGCDRPPGLCQTPHLKPFSERGPTTVENGARFCGFHHTLLHNGDWQARLADDGIVEVIPPPRIDPAQRPRRNERHELTTP